MSTDLTDVEGLARSLGEEIANLPEHERFVEATRAVEADGTAQERIERFEQLRQEYHLARQTGQATEADVERLREAQQELHSLPVMEEFLAARSELQDRLETINRTVSEPLAVDFGEEAGGCCQDD